MRTGESANAWLDRRFRDSRESGTPASLTSDLIDRRPFAYLFRRTRYMVAGDIYRAFVHAASFLFLQWAFPSFELRSLFVQIQLLAVFDAAYWGLLEPLRERTRAVGRREKHRLVHQIDETRAYYLTVAFIPLAWALSATAYALTKKYRHFSPFDAIFIVFALRAGLQAVNAHSATALTSLRRLWMPKAQWILPPLIGFAASVAFFFAIGPWGIPAAMGLESIARFAWQRSRLSKAYRALKYPRARFRIRLPFSAWLAMSFRSALNATFFRLDSLVMAALIRGLPEDGALSPLIVQLGSPFFRLLSDWSRTLYLDLSLATDAFERWRIRQLERATERKIVLFLCPPSLAGAILFAEAPENSLAPSLALLLVFSTVTGLTQFQAYRVYLQGRALKLEPLLAGWIGAAFLIRASGKPISLAALLAGATFLSAATWFILRVVARAPAGRPAERARAVYSIGCMRALGRKEFFPTFVAELGRDAVATRLSPGRILLFWPHEETFDPTRVLRAGRGLITSIDGPLEETFALEEIEAAISTRASAVSSNTEVFRLDLRRIRWHPSVPEFWQTLDPIDRHRLIRAAYLSEGRWTKWTIQGRRFVVSSDRGVSEPREIRVGLKASNPLKVAKF